MNYDAWLTKPLEDAEAASEAQAERCLSTCYRDKCTVCGVEGVFHNDCELEDLDHIGEDQIPTIREYKVDGEWRMMCPDCGCEH